MATTPEWPMSSRVADATGTLSQAQAVLSLIVECDAEPLKTDACHGAATILDAVVTQLHSIEVELRSKEREGR